MSGGRTSSLELRSIRSVGFSPRFHWLWWAEAHITFLCKSREGRGYLHALCVSILRAAIVLFALVLLSGVAWAQTSQPEIVSVRIGMDRLYKLGHWTPVEVTLKGGAQPITGRVEIVVPDCDGVPSRVVTSPSRPIQLSPGQTASAVLYVRFGQEDGSLKVSFRDQAGEAQVDKVYSSVSDVDSEHPPVLLSTEQQLIVSVGPSIGLDDGLKSFSKSQRERVRFARLEGDDAVSRLPTRWYGYEGVSAVVLATNQPDQYRLLENNERLEALDQWVRMGGRLVLFAGAEAPALLAGGPAGHPLARFAPGAFDKLVVLQRTSALEQYGESLHPVFPPGAAQGISVPQLVNIRGRIDLRDGETPLVVRTPRSFGEVVFVAADFNVAPLSKWEGRGEFLRKLMNWKTEPDREDGSVGFGRRMTHLGITDLSGQLRGALEQFAGIRVVPFVSVALLIAVYILLIGPGDYFFVKKVLKRMEWTWVTFPIIVVVFSALAYGLARWSKGSQVQINQVDLVDVDVESRFLRGTSWLTLFSPATEAYRFTLRPQLAGQEETVLHSTTLGWLGLPGSALGGMSNRTAGPALFPQPYEYSPDLDALRDVPIPVWASKSLTARYSAESELNIGTDFALDFTGELVGTLTNSLSLPLSDCVLAYERFAYDLKRIEPGQTVEIGHRTLRVDLSTILNGRRLDFDAEKKSYAQTSTAYDQAGYDVPGILRQMMFYDAAGGRGYTNLGHDYQRFVDLSGHLATGRAILIGYALQPGDGGNRSAAAAVLERDGRPVEQETPDPKRPDKHWTCYRFVLPVVAQKP